MGVERRFLLAATALARSRRLWLAGKPGPWFSRAAASAPGPADAREHGAAATAVSALTRSAGAIDEGLAALSRTRVERPREGPCSLRGAFGRLATLDDRDDREALAAALVRALAEPVWIAASAFAQAADVAAEMRLPEVAPEAEVAAAERLLRATGDAAGDVLAWASGRLGRPRHARLAWPDAAVVLRAPDLDGRFSPAGDPWPPILTWREDWGLTAGAVFETASGWLGAWALRRGGEIHVGTSGPPGALRRRFAMQAAGRLDVLAEAGEEALVPADATAADLLGALYPLLLSDRRFLARTMGVSPEVDDPRRLALVELLLARLSAAATLVQKTFAETRALDTVRDAAADAFRRALFAPLPPEVGLLFCRPFAPPLASPRAIEAALALAGRLTEDFDEDWWRNPRAAPEVRRLAARAAQEPLDALAPTGDSPDILSRWATRALGS